MSEKLKEEGKQKLEALAARAAAFEEKGERGKLASEREPTKKAKRDEKNEELEKKIDAIKRKIVINSKKLDKLEIDYHKDDEKIAALNDEWNVAFTKNLKDMTPSEKAITHGDEDALAKEEQQKLGNQYKLLSRNSENSYKIIDLAQDNIEERQQERIIIEREIERRKAQDPENYHKTLHLKYLNKKLAHLVKEDKKDQKLINQQGRKLKKINIYRKNQLKNIERDIKQGEELSNEDKKKVEEHINRFILQYEQKTKDQDLARQEIIRKEYNKLLKLVENPNSEKKLNVEETEFESKDLRQIKKLVETEFDEELSNDWENITNNQVREQEITRKLQKEAKKKEKPLNILKNITKNQVKKPSIEELLKDQKKVDPLYRRADRGSPWVRPNREMIKIIPEQEIRRISLKQRLIQATIRLIKSTIKYITLPPSLFQELEPTIEIDPVSRRKIVQEEIDQPETTSLVRELLIEYRKQQNYQQITNKVNKMIIIGKYAQQSGYKELGADGKELNLQRREAEIITKKKPAKSRYEPKIQGTKKSRKG